MTISIEVNGVKYDISRSHDNKFTVSKNSSSLGANFSTYSTGEPRTFVVTIINDKIVDGLPFENVELELAIEGAIASLQKNS